SRILGNARKKRNENRAVHNPEVSGQRSAVRSEENRECRSHARFCGAGHGAVVAGGASGGRPGAGRGAHGERERVRRERENVRLGRGRGAASWTFESEI